MELTKEQQDIINSVGSIKVNAVAGSGKTTTIIEYAAARPPNSKILYLAFNKSVKLEASGKFAERKLSNVRVETAHSLAFKNIMPGSAYTLKQQGYSTNEVVELLKIRGGREKRADFIAANHIKKFVAYFCNSDKKKVQDLNYLDTVSDPEAIKFVRNYYSYLEKQTRIFLMLMDKGEIEITHDFYLKKFQLSSPQLGFDYILFDEGQDASPAMLDIFLKQNCVKLIVGDAHQQIYSWRYAVNSLELVDFDSFGLTESFRFGQNIANAAIEFLKMKRHIKNYNGVFINGKQSLKRHGTKAVLARTNLGLLKTAIEYVVERRNVSRIYFEGNFHSYTYADEGASLYDVLHLFNERHHLIKDKIIKSMKNFDELEKYVEETEDVQLSMMMDLVKKYRNKLPGIIRTIKEKHLTDDEKEKAEMIFSTVHKCKGMEYDEVFLVNDFINEEKLEKASQDSAQMKQMKTKLNEEINLLYVAATRAKFTLHIPSALMPVAIKESAEIKILKSLANNYKQAGSWNRDFYSKDKSERKYTVEQARTKNVDAYKPWTKLMDKELALLYSGGKSISSLSNHFKRTIRAIEHRLRKLNLD